MWLGDESGYQFTVHAEEEVLGPYTGGWKAHVVLQEHGVTSAEATLAGLLIEAEQLVWLRRRNWQVSRNDARKK